MRLLSSSRRGLHHQPASSNPHLSGWPFTPESAWIMTSDRLGRGRCDLNVTINNNDLTPIGALGTAVPTDQGWGLQFNGTSNYLETPSLFFLTTYPIAIGAVFRFITGAAGSMITLAQRDIASNGNYYSLLINATNLEAAIRPTTTAQLTLDTPNLTVGKIYAAALVSTSATSHHLWCNGVELTSATNQSTGIGLTKLQIGALVRNTTPTILNVSNYPILMGWYGVAGSVASSNMTELNAVVGEWTKDPWRMFRTTNSAAGLA